MPIGQVTRGTTGTNRLRRIDRWIAQLPALRRAEHPLVVDLGYGASATTTLELHQRLARVRADVEVVGLEIEPSRVAAAVPFARPGVQFAVGGFEVPLPGRGRDARATPELESPATTQRCAPSSPPPVPWLVSARFSPCSSDLRPASFPPPSATARRTT